MDVTVLLICICLLLGLMGFIYFDFRKHFKKEMQAREIDIQKLRKGLNDEINDKPIVDLMDAVKYNNERRK